MSGLLNGIGPAIVGALVTLIAVFFNNHLTSQRNDDDRIQTYNQTLVDDNAGLRTQLKEMKTDLLNLGVRMDTLANENTHLRNEVEQLKSQLTAQRDRYEHELAGVRRDNAMMEERLQTAQGRIYELQDACASLLRKLNTLEAASQLPLTPDVLAPLTAAASATPAHLTETAKPARGKRGSRSRPISTHPS